MTASAFSPVFATASDTADAVRTKRVSARELVDLTFQRIDRVNPPLNAIVWQDRDRTIAHARAADEALAGGAPLGALHCVPITIKNSFAYRGTPNSWGDPALEAAISPRTAMAVERLESAGAIIVGKTNVPVMLGDWQTYNPIHGTTNNPWDLSRTPGGSSGGCAAALAAGLGCLSLGSDLNGSIRIPAHFCGIYGHKPSLGLVSLAGSRPGPWDGSPGYLVDLAAAGPMARSARDLALALSVLGGPDEDEATAWTWRMPAPRQTRLRDFRIGCVLDDPIAPLASDVRAIYEDVLARLEKAGAVVERGWPAGVDSPSHLATYQYLLFSLLTVESDESERERARKRLEKDPGHIPSAATVHPHARWLKESQRRLQFRGMWQQYFERYDVFLLPASFTAAFPHDHVMPFKQRVIDTPDGTRPYVSVANWTIFGSLTGLPATLAPIGRTAAGLPVGIQIVAPMWEDGTSIEFAARLADITGGFTPPPAFAG